MCERGASYAKTWGLGRICSLGARPSLSRRRVVLSDSKGPPVGHTSVHSDSDSCAWGSGVSAALC